MIVGEMVKVLPEDEHNQVLVDNAHPAAWQNPEPAPRYNLVVIGAGTAGLVTAAGAGLGARVALVERHLMGGDCLHVGCVPSKSIIRSARLLADIRGARLFGLQIGDDARADFPGVMERMRRLRAQISHHDSAARFRELGVDVFLGEGRFSGPDTVEVAGRTLRFKKAVVATGARPVEPPVQGLSEAGYLRPGATERLILFSRYPEPGKTKTRLIPCLGAEGAAGLQRQMTEHALSRVLALARDRQLEVEVRFEGGSEAVMAAWLGPGIKFRPQGEGDLGARMERAFAGAFQTGVDRAVIIGTDCPGITSSIIRTAFDLLERFDLVLGPAVF